MISFQVLERKTDDFFARHWACADERPRWSVDLWTGVGPVPSYDKQGCYALVKDEVVTYIGSAVGRGSSNHPHFGLSFRISSYLQRSGNLTENRVEFRFKPGLDYTGLYTLGFPKEFAYLALALELYLILELAPANNKRGV